LLFTSDVDDDNPELYELDPRPLDDGPALVERDATQRTFDRNEPGQPDFDDIYPVNVVNETDADLEGWLPTAPRTRAETSYLNESFPMTDPVDTYRDDKQDWRAIILCSSDG
jgi:hypothetical protein